MTFIVSALLYPCVLAVLCVGSGLLVDALGGRSIPGALLVPVGAAALIALSQLSTYAAALAPATPYLMLAAALAGYALSRRRLARLPRACRDRSASAAWKPARWQCARACRRHPRIRA